MNKFNAEVHRYWLRTIISECEEDRLTDWERSFITTIRAYQLSNAAISDKQEEQLEKLYEKVTR